MRTLPGLVLVACSNFARRLLYLAFLAALILMLAPGLRAQDGSTSLQGIIEDASGARIVSAAITVADPSRGFRLQAVTDAQGTFNFGMLPPGRYDVTASAPGMATKTSRGVELLVGGVSVVHLRLSPAALTQTITVSATPIAVDTQSGEISNVVTQSAIAGLPLNGRRFTDLALLSPDVIQDPRGLTSDSNGDLSVGGIRGFENSFLVDGADDNNSFFAQARGGYRAPYQFSNEVIQEFRVSKNSYSAELGRSGGAVFNVVTKSGTNDWHGTGFYYLRDRSFDAQQPYASSQPNDRQQQFGGTVGGPIRKDRIFFYAGFDQHLLTMPSVVQFANGASSIVPLPTDYDYTDQALVYAAAQKLNNMGGSYPTTMQGNAGFAKVDFNLSPKQLTFIRVSTSRLTGTNNVFFDPSSPITNYAATANGTENVQTESVAASLISSWTNRFATNLRFQFSHDAQDSTANTDQPWTKIYDIMDGFGNPSTLPRDTRENKLHVAETLSYDTGRIHWKFGGDFMQAWIYNYYPYLFDGEYYFDDVKVNPWTYAPMEYGEPLSPLRAFAHGVARYYMQDFGNSVSHPDSRNYAAFMQDTIRVTRNFTLNAGIRYDLQTFQPGPLVSNPLYPASGKIPTDMKNFSPRIGFAYSIGDKHTTVIRGGGGIFYMLIPAMYAAQVATDNGIQQSSLFLNLMNPAQAALFPTYPTPLVNCPPGTLVCNLPKSLAGLVTTDISAFAPNFQTPYTEQANLTVQHEFGRSIVGTVSYAYVRGVHEIRSLDVNLPAPTVVDYPVYNETGTTYLGMYSVDSFSTWQTTASPSCPYPPCINPVQRPDPQLGAINSYQSAASSLYNGVTVSLKRTLSHGMYFQVGYTLAKATDDGPDALVVGRPGNVQNAYATSLEWGPSVNDQRNRFIAAWVSEPKFHFDNGRLNALANHWKVSSVITAGSGRPVNATLAGDPNGDGNIYNDRLPGYERNAFIGPDYFSTDLRLTRTIRCGEHVVWNLVAESFNVFNRNNSRVQISDDGFYNSAGEFVGYTSTVKGTVYPGEFLVNSQFLTPTNAYAPRQVQFSLRLTF
ncbi:MAG: TonB-dependent receptor [Candidatus Korobacteraceae bacterium]|jgi:carboxypeptidase family protein/TonB-dependent receptor-like protein